MIVGPLHQNTVLPLGHTKDSVRLRCGLMIVLTFSNNDSGVGASSREVKVAVEHVTLVEEGLGDSFVVVHTGVLLSHVREVQVP